MNSSLPFLIDANVWIHALNTSAVSHSACRNWLNQVTKEGRVLLVNDLTECALLRIGTHPQLNISNPEAVMEFHLAMLTYPYTSRVSPSDRHQEILRTYIRTLSLLGNDINDAWLAALAIENQATLVSLDQGFARFPSLSWINPATL